MIFSDHISIYGHIGPTLGAMNFTIQVGIQKEIFENKSVFGSFATLHPRAFGGIYAVNFIIKIPLII